MHATIQKPIEEIISNLKEGEKVFVIGCDNCASKCKSGGTPETRAMAQQLVQKGINVIGWGVPNPAGISLCKVSNTKRYLEEEKAEALPLADSYIVLACGQGIHAVLDATDGGLVHAGCDTICGAETVTDGLMREFCSLCGECIIDYTGGLCPITLCSKSLLNGPCGGSIDGKCEVNRSQDCGWNLIYQRLRDIGRLDLMRQYRDPKNYAKKGHPRQLKLDGHDAVFTSNNTVTERRNVAD